MMRGHRKLLLDCSCKEADQLCAVQDDHHCDEQHKQPCWAVIPSHTRVATIVGSAVSIIRTISAVMSRSMPQAASVRATCATTTRLRSERASQRHRGHRGSQTLFLLGALCVAVVTEPALEY